MPEQDKIEYIPTRRKIYSESGHTLLTVNSIVSPEQEENIEREKRRVESQAIDVLTKTPRRRGKGKKTIELPQALTPQIASIGNKILTNALKKYLNVELFALQECLLAMEGDPAARARIWERIEGRADIAPDAGPQGRTMADILAEIAGATPKAVIEAAQSIKVTLPAQAEGQGAAIVNKAMSIDGQDKTDAT